MNLTGPMRQQGTAKRVWGLPIAKKVLTSPPEPLTCTLCETQRHCTAVLSPSLNSSRTMQYSYITIPANHIRLLKPARHSGLNNRSILTFSVETYPIARAPPYTAVSYVWGLGAASREIRLDGHGFAIRPNLWSCLYNLTLLQTNSYRDTHWTHMWIDAVCINQKDEKEKSQQVRAMSEVYSRAVEVSAWLGPQRLPHWLQWQEDVTTTVESSEWLLCDNVPELAERPYWSRMWIVQELLLADHIRVHVGDISFDFNELSYQVHLREAADTEDIGQLLAYIEARDTDHMEIQHPLHEILLRFKDGQCSDPRDKVFALLSLVNEEDRRVLGHCFPNYSLTHDAVVVITLSYLRDFHNQTITCDSHDLFKSLGASPSRMMRQRLIAASASIDAFNDMRSIRHADFRQISFYSWQDPPESQSDHGRSWVDLSDLSGNQDAHARWRVDISDLLRDPPTQGQNESLIRRVAANVWWPILCCGALWYFGRGWVPWRPDTLVSIVFAKLRRL